MEVDVAVTGAGPAGLAAAAALKKACPDLKVGTGAMQAQAAAGSRPSSDRGDWVTHLWP